MPTCVSDGHLPILPPQRQPANALPRRFPANLTSEIARSHGSRRRGDGIGRPVTYGCLGAIPRVVPPKFDRAGMSASLSLNPYESPRPPDTGPIGRAVVDDSIIIHFHGSLTVDDMFEAERLAQSAWKKHEHWITWTMALLTVLCVLGVGAFDLYCLLYDDAFDAELPSPLGFLVVVIGTGLALYHPRLVRARAMKVWAQSKGPYAWTS